MAFVDRNNSRERAVSGVASVLVVSVIGYALVTGLAMTVVREPTWIIPGTSYPADPKPKPPEPVKKLPHPAPSSSPASRPQHPLVQMVPPGSRPVIDVGKIPIDLGNGAGNVGPSTVVNQPETIDHSASAQPLRHGGDWVTTDDYPTSAEREGAQGRTVFRLDIGTDGRVTGCTVATSSGSDTLDRATCRLLTVRARFKPALDADGHPVTGSYTSGVTWRLPAD
jgi:protein TonB